MLYNKEEAYEITGLKKEKYRVKEKDLYFLFVPVNSHGVMIFSNPILFDRYTGKYRPFYPPTEPKEILNLFLKSR